MGGLVYIPREGHVMQFFWMDTVQPGGQKPQDGLPGPEVLPSAHWVQDELPALELYVPVVQPGQ